MSNYEIDKSRFYGKNHHGKYYHNFNDFFFTVENFSILSFD